MSARRTRATADRRASAGRQEQIAAYKRILRACIETRPSGLRKRLAEVMGTHKSFVSLITNPADPTPIPARHLAAIAEVCRLSERERQAFFAAHAAAHAGPSRRGGPSAAAPRPTKILQIEVPHLADARRQLEMEAFLREVARRIGAG
ncbi:MAG: hypothetical protein IRY94_19730, partial [Rhodospirillaceae bacterium]|nr:hypothetical protein [Rhodospirillaceae bacterium]